MPDAVVETTHPDRELTEEERLHLGLPEVATTATATVAHPDRELTPDERAHLRLPPIETE